MKFLKCILLLPLAVMMLAPALAWADPDFWSGQWPNTNFDKTEIDYREILSGGVPKDGIPAIDSPKFIPVAEAGHLTATEPVIGVIVDGEAKAYPLQVLMWHEIVNDEIAGIPISVTFCPLCNASLVFDRRVDDPERGEMVLDFGTTGKLRNSDLVMYDRQTESWWQQFLGRAIVGDLTGLELKMIPVRIESFAKFKERAPQGSVLIPEDDGFRRYGMNPYQGYDSLHHPFLYEGAVPDEVAPLARVVVAEKQAWALDYLRSVKRIETPDGLVITWEKGQNSALDAAVIGEGVDIGNVTVQRKMKDGYEDVLYTVDFAFAHFAFHPETPIVTK
ncbi:DUF3179 domain-containing protein [Sneathiella marina]|uniref:DUF3179 domain-containing protein n=1 Tax=Sneathiella marina TaxID=2950108 RepID=A0ABY4W3A2_9PROT|nr:DUF3179 domain-containing protein [Sneathiella marina]USG60205.1 DUF3179 domain-containing protein [Sneathiella marina]